MRYLALAGAVVSLSACSAGANGGPIAAGDFASALAGAYCEYARSCVSPENDAPLTQRYLAASSSCAEDFFAHRTRCGGAASSLCHRDRHRNVPTRQSARMRRLNRGDLQRSL
jgi:hypothetical protein